MEGKIKRLDNSLNHVATYTYSAMKDSGKLTNITCIAHLSSKYFILGSGTKFAICFLDTNNNLLIEKSRFSITDTDLSIYSCDKTGKEFFEVESITSPDSGSTMYILANVIDSGERSDILYSPGNFSDQRNTSERVVNHVSIVKEKWYNY